MLVTDITTQAAVPAQGDNLSGPAINAPTSATFKQILNRMYQL